MGPFHHSPGKFKGSSYNQQLDGFFLKEELLVICRKCGQVGELKNDIVLL
jgi:hypothetical protein